MTESYSIELQNTISLTARLKQSVNEENIKNLSKLISISYKKLLLQVNKTSDEYLQLLRLRRIIIDTYNQKQSLLRKLHFNSNKIKQENNTSISSELVQVFHDLFTAKPDKHTSTEKAYSLDEITQQIDTAFNTDSLLTPDGKINTTTQELLLQRLYKLIDDKTISSITIKSLVNKVINGKKELLVVPVKEEKSNIVNGIEITPSISGVCEEDEKRLKDGIDQLFQS